MAKITRSSTRWTLLSIMPATGWRVVWHDDAQHHFYTPLDALALGIPRDYDVETRQRVLDHPSYRIPDEESWDIVGLDYDLGGSGFSVVNECGNYCGLIPPHITDAEWEEAHSCHLPAKKEL